jgi:hypothetical protein
LARLETGLPASADDDPARPADGRDPVRITSVARSRADAALLLAHWRNHWGIENRLHWVRDVTFGEDQCQVKTGHAPQNLAAFRNAALSLLRLADIQEIAPTLRDFAYQPRKLLRFLGIMKN